MAVDAEKKSPHFSPSQRPSGNRSRANSQSQRPSAGSRSQGGAGITSADLAGFDLGLDGLDGDAAGAGGAPVEQRKKRC